MCVGARTCFCHASYVTSFLLSAHSMRVFVPMNSYRRESFFCALMDCTTQSLVTHVDMTSGYFNRSLDQLSSCPWSDVVMLIASLSLLSSLKYPIAFMVPRPTRNKAKKIGSYGEIEMMRKRGQQSNAGMGSYETKEKRGKVDKELLPRYKLQHHC